MGYSPWGHGELDTTEQLTFAHFFTSYFIIYISLYLSDKELVHMIREAGTSHYLLSASWRPKKTSGLVLVQL